MEENCSCGWSYFSAGGWTAIAAYCVTRIVMIVIDEMRRVKK